MKRLKAASMILSLLASSLSGCAASPSFRPVVDMRDVHPILYETDLRECKAYAEQIDPVRSAAAGVVVGAVFGAVLGAAIGGRGFAGYGARVGGAEGFGIGAGQGVAGQFVIVKNCLAGRGYRVLL
jgi:outer membrane lipoprotein SlyB